MQLSYTQRIKKTRGLCVMPGCTKPRGSERALCYMHKSRKEAIDNPIGYTFNALRNNAKRRHKKFSITLDEFKVWVAQTGYMDKKGKTGLSMSIDRPNNSKGYEIGNMRMMTLAGNSRKKFVDERLAKEYPQDFNDNETYF